MAGPGVSRTQLPGNTDGFIMGSPSDDLTDEQLAERERERQAAWDDALRTHRQFLVERGRVVDQRLAALAKTEQPVPAQVAERLTLEAQLGDFNSRVEQVDAEL